MTRARFGYGWRLRRLLSVPETWFPGISLLVAKSEDRRPVRKRAEANCESGRALRRLVWYADEALTGVVHLYVHAAVHTTRWECFRTLSL